MRRNYGFIAGIIFALVFFVAPGAHASNSNSVACATGTITYWPMTLWPPNHHMRPITIQYTDTDPSAGTLYLQVNSISDNDEPDGNGCGQPEAKQGGHYQGVGNTASGANPLTLDGVKVRSERCGPESDRIYDINVTCCDDWVIGFTGSTCAGNFETVDLWVTVPHDKARH